MSFSNNYPRTINNLYLWLDAQDNSTITLNANLAITQIREKASNIMLTSLGNISNIFLTNDINNKQTILFNNYLYNNVFLQGNVAFNSNVYTGSSFIVMKSVNQAGLYGSPLQNNAILNWGNIYTFGYSSLSPSTIDIQNSINNSANLNAIIIDTTTNGSVSFSNTQARFATFSAYFTGNIAYFDLNDVTSLSSSLTGNFTVEMWYYPTNSTGNNSTGNLSVLLGNYQTLFCTASNTFNSYFLMHNSDGTFNIATPGSGLFIKTGNTSPSININQWNHLALTYANSTTTTRLYVNGNLTTSTNSLNLGSLPWTNDWVIGCTNSPSISGNGPATVSVVTGASQSTADKMFGTSAYYANGTGHITVNNISTTNMTGNWTVECWFKSTSYVWQNLWNCYFGGPSSVDCWCALSDQQVRIILGTNSTRNILNQVPNIGYNLNTWYHVAVVYNGTTYAAYLNGTRFFNITSSVILTPTTFSKTNIGTWAGSQLMFGYIDEFRISSVARYSGASFTVPTSAFGFDNSTTLLLHFDGGNGSTTFTADYGIGYAGGYVNPINNGYLNHLRISNTLRYTGNTYTIPSDSFNIDSSTVYLNSFDQAPSISSNYLPLSQQAPNTFLPFTTSSLGTVLFSTVRSRFGTSSLFVTGGSSCFNINVTELNSLPTRITGDFTIEMWYNPTNSTGNNSGGLLGNYQTIFGTGTDTIDSFFLLHNTDNYFYIAVPNGTVSRYDYYGGTSTNYRINLNQWNHLGLSFTSSTNTVRLFVNGFLSYSGTNTISSFNWLQRWTLGCSNTPFTNGYNYGINAGYIDFIRVSNTLRYTNTTVGTTYTIPTNAFDVDRFTVYLNSLEQNSGIILSNSQLQPTPVSIQTNTPTYNTSNASISLTQSRFGVSSVYFNSNAISNFIDITGLANIRLQGNWTYECWVYPGSSSAASGGTNYQTLWSVTRGNNANIFMAVSLAPVSRRLTLFLSNISTSLDIASNIQGTTSATLNAWNHIALVWNTRRYTLFLNGNLQVSVTNSNIVPHTNLGNICIGALDNDTRFGLNNGYIDEFRISSSARYAGNFIPTTSLYNPDTTTVFLHHFESYFTTTTIQNAGQEVPAINNYLDYQRNYIINNNWTLGNAFTNVSTTINNGNAFISTLPFLTNTSSNLQIARGPSGNTTPLVLGEILIYNRALSSLETANIIDYLNNKWNIYTISNSTTSTSFVFGRNTDINNRINQFQMNGFLDDFLISNVSRYTGNTYILPNAFVKTEQGYLLVNFNGNSNTFTIANTEVSNVTLTTVNYSLTNYLNYNYYWASNGAIISTLGQTRFGTSSLAINNNYAIYTHNTTLSSVPYTIEFWYYITSYGVLLGGAIGNTFYNIITISFTSTIITFPGMSSPLVINNFNELETWTHIALVCTTNSITFYFKGSNLGNFSGSYTSNFNALMLGVGGSGTSSLSSRTLVGFIDEFRLSNNARYTSNFNPQLSSFVFDSNTITLNHFDGSNNLTNFNLTVDTITTGVNSVVTNTNNRYQYTLHDSTISTTFTLFGTASLFINSNYHALVLKDQITSPSTIEFWYYIPRRNTYTITTSNNNVSYGIDNNFSLLNFASFNGTSSFINSDFETMNLTNNSWTIETWFNATSISGTQNIFTVVCSSVVLSLMITSNVLFFRVGNSISSWNIVSGYQVSGTLSTSRWYHIAIVNTAGSIQGYISGTPYGSAVSASVNISSISRLLLGQQINTTNFFNGNLSQFRISLSTRYTSTFTPSSVNFILDTNTLYFNKLDNNEVLSTYMNLSPVYGTILGTYTSSTFYTIVSLTSSTTTVSLIGMTPITINNFPQINKWTHLAITCGTNAIQLFIDGCLMGSYTGTYTLTNVFLLGSGGTGSTQVTNGLYYIDSFRISNNIRYTSPFVIPTSAFVYDANTTVLNHFNGINGSQDINITDDKTSTGTNNVTLLTSMYYFNYSSFGAIISNTAITRFGSNSLYLNNNYSVLSINTLSKPFTIEFFYNLVFTGILLGYYTTTFNTLVELTNMTTIITIPGAPTQTIFNFPQTTVWTHFTLVGTTTGFSVYINGVLQRSYTGNYTVPSILVIGGGGSNSNTVTSNLVGYIDELRISNNIRYTSSFNVPTSAFNKDTSTITLNHFNGNNGSNNLLLAEDFITTTSSSISSTSNLSNVLYTLVNSSINSNSSVYGGGALNLNQSYCIINFMNNLPTTFTLEFWYQCTTLGTVVSYRTNAGVYGNLITLTSNATQIQLPGMSGPITIFDLPELGLWTHLAIMGNGANITTYIGGIFFNTTPASYTMPDTLFLGIPSASASSLGTPIFVGFIDEFRISNIRRYSSNFLLTGPFAFDTNTITLNHLDNVNILSSVDTTIGTNTITNAPSTLTYLYQVSPPLRAPSNQTFTRVNGVVQSTTQTRFGTSSLYLTGGNYLTVSNIISTNMTGNWTVECWVYPLNIGNWQLIWNCYQANASDVNCWCEINNNNIGFILGSGNGRQVCDRTPTTPITINTWHHVACVYNNGTYSAYLNGIRFLNITSATVVPSNTFINVNLGSWAGGQLLFGYIDEFRISSIARYFGTSFTVPTSAFGYDTSTTLLLHFDNGNNSSIFEADISTASIQMNTNIRKFGSSSLQFLSGYFTLERISIFTSFTLEFWFYCTSYGSMVSTFSTSNINFQNIIYITNTFIEITLPNFSAPYRIFCLPQLNTWYNLAIIYVASYYDSTIRQTLPNHIRVFLNGYYIGYYPNNFSSLSSFIFGIGSGNVSTSTTLDRTNKFQGYIDELQISSGSRYTSSYNVQNSEYFRDTRTIVLNHFNSNQGNTDIISTDDSTQNTSSFNSFTELSPYILYMYTTFGNAALNTFISGINLASIQFNGGYVLFNNKDNFTNPFTIEMFFYYTTVGTILGFLNTSGFNDILRITSTTVIFSFPGTTSSSSSLTLASSTWHHLAITGNLTNVNLFINGNLISSGTNYTSISNLLFGIGITSTFRGYMTEFRTSNNIRYTTTFTPTKVPFIRDSTTIALNHFNGKSGVTDFNTTEVITIDRNTLVNTQFNFYVNDAVILDANVTANLIGTTPNTAANSVIDVISKAPEGAIIQRVRQLITTNIKVYKPANVSPVTQSLTQTTVTIPNPTPNYTYALGLQDSTQFPNNVQYSARFFLKVLNASNNIVTTFTTPISVKLQLTNYTGNSSTLVVQRLDEVTNVYEELGYANTTGVYQEYLFTLSSNSDYQVLNSNVNVQGIGGGDPHFAPLFGKEYTFCDDTKTYRLFENTFENKYLSEKIFINGKTWRLPSGQARRSKMENRRYLYNFTFLKYVSIIFVKNGITESLIIDMDTLKFHKFTSIDDENNLTLPEVEDESSLNLTELSFDNITAEQRQLYRIPIDTYVEDNTETFDRNITLTTVKLGVIKIELVCLPTDELDRNHVKLNIERDCSEFNSFGLLVKEGQIKELSSIMEM